MNIKRLFILTGTVLLGLTLVSVWLLFLSAPLESARAAGPWYVAPGGSDSNSCLSPGEPCNTINGAIGKATGGDTIFVATATYTGTGDEVVLINKDITLSGGWDANFTTQGSTSTIDGEDSRRGITVNSNVTTTVIYFTVQNGYTDDVGGGIRIQESGTLTLTNSTVAFNTANEDGGGIGIFESGMGNIYLESSVVSGNTANYGEGGGIFIVGGHLSVSKSWVVANATMGNQGGGIGLGGVSSVNIENSIIAGNDGYSAGGGIWFHGGGPYHIVNSHIVGNYAIYGGAAMGADEEPTWVNITNTLIISNTAEWNLGDGISGPDWEYLLSYCDTYGNSPDGSASITRYKCLGTPPEDGLDPMIAGGALPSGVGPDYATEWLSYDYRLLPGSPAIDAGISLDAPTTDIDGIPRDAKPDMGAYEWVYRILLPLVSK